MSDGDARQARLAHVLRTLRLPAATPRLLTSYSNDTWRIGGVVLRICWRGDRYRFAREAAVTASLPSGVPYPQVLEVGGDDDLAWQVTRAIDGVSLAAAWPRLTPVERRSAMHQVGRALGILNTHTFPPDVIATLVMPPLDFRSTESIIGADIIPLPYQRALSLIEPARNLPYVDPKLIDDVGARLEALAGIDPLDSDLAASGCVHGDAHPGNVMWHDGRVVALLDFEWVRQGPPDLELEPYLRADLSIDLSGAEVRDMLCWLAESHPAAFAAADLIDRLWLYQLASALRQLLIEPPDRPCEQLEPDHPVRVLQRIVGSQDHLNKLLPHR